MDEPDEWYIALDSMDKYVKLLNILSPNTAAYTSHHNYNTQKHVAHSYSARCDICSGYK